MNNTKLLVAGIATALSLGYGASALAVTAANTVHAESTLNITDFKIAEGNNEQGGGSQIAYCFGAFSAGCKMKIASGGSTGSTSSSLNGFFDSQSFNAPLQTNQGVFSSMGVSPSSYGASGESTTTGDALNFGSSGDVIHVSSEANLDATGFAGGIGAQGLSSVSFSIQASSSFRAQVSFAAELILAAGIGPNYQGSADASVTWQLTIVDQTANRTLIWAPTVNENTGLADGLSGLNSLWGQTNYSQAFSLNNLISTDPANGFPDVAYGFNGKTFEIEANLVGGHSYNMTLAQNNTVNAAQVVPEPTTLALLGLGMLGMGAARRRKA